MAKFSLESHSIRIHPILWKWAKEDAGPAGYESGVSGLIAGLILYNHALGKRPHWLTADLINHKDKLEVVIKEIEEQNPLETSTTWLEHRIAELLDGAPKPP
jgi:hypothetical protein